MWKLLYLNGNPTQYYICSTGQIKDDKKIVRQYLKKDVLNDDVVKYFCNLLIGLKPCSLAVDKLVAHAFIKKGKMCTRVVHLNENVLDNNVENLRWTTTE